MASSKAVEEKNLKIIRELMRLPANKTCFDCTQKGPVYANLTHGTFICTTCSGVHREFSHRCKSVSMSTFTSAEVEKLQNMGNEAAEKIWHARWNRSEFPPPDGNNPTYLRKFISMTYEEKLWIDKANFKNEEASPPSGKSKKVKKDKKDKKERKEKKKSKKEEEDEDSEDNQEFPKPEPLSNILGNDIPSLNFANPDSKKISKSQSKSTNNASLIDLLGDSFTQPTQSTSKSNINSDLASLSFSPSQPNNSFDSFGFQQVNQSQQVNQPQQVNQFQQSQQIKQMQSQLQAMQAALASAQLQMKSIQQQISIGQANFNSLNQDQKSQLSMLLQKQQAMNQQYSAMTLQYQTASERLQATMKTSANNQNQLNNNSTAFNSFGNTSSQNSDFSNFFNTPASNNQPNYNQQNYNQQNYSQQNYSQQNYNQQNSNRNLFELASQNNVSPQSSKSSSSLDFMFGNSSSNNDKKASFDDVFSTQNQTSYQTPHTSSTKNFDPFA